MRNFVRSFDTATAVGGMIAFAVLYGGLAAAGVWLAMATLGQNPNPPITAAVIAFSAVTIAGGLYGGSERYRLQRAVRQR